MATAKRTAKAKDNTVTKAKLKERGWTDAGIIKFLGEPDATKPNPIYKSAAPMQLYNQKRVEKVEKSSVYRAWKTKSEKRKDAAMEAVSTKREKVRAIVRAWTPTIPVMALEMLRNKAIASYNSMQEDRTMERGREWTPATESSDEGFLDRITVNYARHALTNYDGLLYSLGGKVGINEAIAMVRGQVYAAIAAAYPDLADECRLQEDKRIAEEENRRMMDGYAP